MAAENSIGTAETSSSDEEDYQSAPEDAGGVLSTSLPAAEGPPSSVCGAREQPSKEGSVSVGLESGGKGGDAEEDKGKQVLEGVENLSLSDQQQQGGGGGGAKEERAELSEEQIKELKEQADQAKKRGNEHFKNGDYTSAIDCYTEALRLYPRRSYGLSSGDQVQCSDDEAGRSGDSEKPSDQNGEPADPKSGDPTNGASHDQPTGPCDHERAVCFANRAACHMKKESHQDVIDDCSEALTLEPHYLKALLRRAQSYEVLEKYEDALEDYKKALELDGSQLAARQALVYLPDKIKEQHEKLKTEMLGKLKELGNAILNPFGLSTDNFQLQQDPNSGGYSINFKR